MAAGCNAGAAAALLLLAALLLAAQAAAVQQQGDEDDVNELPAPGGGLVRFHGASPSFDVASAGNASFVSVRLGKIYEASPSGQAVNGRRIMSLAAASPTYSQGNYTTLDGLNMTYVSMRLPLSGLAHDFAECAGGAPAGFVNASTAASQGYVELRVYFGFTADATFPFGANNTVTAAANSTKFSVEAASWPFCDATSSFVVELHLKTGAKNGSHPKDVDEDGSDDAAGASNSTSPSNSSSTAGVSTNSSSGSSVPPANRHRRMLANSNGGSNGAGSSHSNSAGSGSSNRLNGSGSGSSNGHAQGGGANRPRDPRVAGASPRRFALLAGNASQAVVLNMEPYAYDAVDGSTLMNVTAAINADGEHTAIRLAFPAFASSLYWDPSLALTDAVSAGYSSAELAALNITLAAAPAKNGGATRAGVASAASLLGAALLAAALT